MPTPALFKMPCLNNNTISMYGLGDTVEPYDRASLHTNKLLPTRLHPLLALDSVP